MTVLCDFVHGSKISELFDQEVPDGFGSQSPHKPVIQIDSALYEPQSTDISWGYAYQYALASLLSTETVNLEYQPTSP